MLLVLILIALFFLGGDNMAKFNKNIKYSKDGFTVNPSLPAGLKNFTVERIFIDGKLRNIKVKDGKVFID